MLAKDCNYHIYYIPDSAVVYTELKKTRIHEFVDLQ